jgi:HEAT repeat protein
MLDEEVRRSTGSLVKKIDPDTIPLLLEEMASAVRIRRTRAIKIAVAMDAVEALEEKLIELTRDDDHLVRLDAVKALTTMNSAGAVQALANAQFDNSVPVQQEAIRCLEELRGRSLRLADDVPARAPKGRPHA